MSDHDAPDFREEDISCDGYEEKCGEEDDVEAEEDVGDVLDPLGVVWEDV